MNVTRQTKLLKAYRPLSLHSRAQRCIIRSL